MYPPSRLNAGRAGPRTRLSARSGPQPRNHSGEAAANLTATLRHRRFVHRRSAARHECVGLGVLAGYALLGATWLGPSPNAPALKPSRCSSPSSRRCERCARHRVFLLVKAAQASILRDCKAAHTSLAICLLESGTATSIWRQEANMARKPDRLAFVFAMVIAMAMTVLAVKTWAGPPAPDSDSAAPVPPRETIYRPQHWNLY